MRGKIFISYSYPLNSKIKFLVEYLRKESDNLYEVLFDTTHVDHHHHGNIRAFIEQVEQADVAILFLSKTYHDKVREQDENVGVYDEYKRIVNRYKKQKTNGYYQLPTKENNKLITSKVLKIVKFFRVIPIMVSGNMPESVPNDLIIEHLKVFDFSGLHVTEKNGRLSAPTFKKEFKKDMDSILEEIKDVCSAYQEEFKRNWQTEFHELFEDTKARWHDYETFQKYKKAFVETRVYGKIINQSTKFLIGRKGSGKSTLSDIIPLLDQNQYLGSIRINIDKFPMEMIYTLLFQKDKGVKSDLNLLSLRDSMIRAWEIFIITCFIELTITDLAQDKNFEIDDDTFGLFWAYLKDILKAEDPREIRTFEDRHSIYLLRSFELLYNFTESNRAALDSFVISAQKRAHDPSLFRKYALTNPIVEKLQIVTKRLKGSKIFFSFDGFDTSFDLFRRKDYTLEEHDLDVEIQERIKFEIDWLWSFIQLIIDAKGLSPTVKGVFDLLNYCITIPRDRFLEIEKRDRDKYRFNHQQFDDLHWSGPELCDLLGKRLELLSGYPLLRSKTPIKKFEDLCKTIYGTIPYEIDFNFNGKQHVRIPLFCYILRHTFWRPREILWYYTGILNAERKASQNGTKLTTEKIRELVRFTTAQVVESEFLGEFESSFLNIRDVLNRFEEAEQILNYEDLYKILNNVEFKITNNKIATIESKIDYLYEIGFLGTFNTQKSISKSNKNNSLMDYSFIFTNGVDHARKASSNFKNVLFVIHPVFCEKYSIDTSKNDFVLSFTMEDIENHELVVFGTRRG
ncbi:energy-coupling factor transporter ATP-binding protein EcfA2 [Runella defluvii]|uniref:Energy-coupling factor transporter ATP-binding protein EcfA2 n=1 Tax=Runella defluvii TaxID=370973 RepID=A0A7W6ESZ8_9BACT|nr:hypothetical protein [Runella defluvii]MBB3841052.1 energy-coupling factor transporter ATP-binding protein EcfA2 [Runella defluvii]